MKRNMTSSVLALALFISLFLTGNAFANIYAFVLEKNSKKILINNIESKTIERVIDLDDDDIVGDPEDDGGTITAMATSPGERYLYFVTDNGNITDGRLYQVDLRGDTDQGIVKYQITFLDSVGVRPKAVVAGLNGVYVYVANFGSDTVSVYSRVYATTVTRDGFNKPVALDVTVGSAERGCDVFVANMGGNSVTVFNTFSQIDIALENSPTDVLVTPDFEYVYVCNSDSGTANGRITVIKPVDYLDFDDEGDDIIEPGENEVLANIEITGALPTRMAMVFGGDYIYAVDPVFTAEDDGDLEEDGDLTVTSGAGKMSIIDCSGRENEVNTFSNNLTLSAAMTGIASTKDAHQVYTVDGLNSTAYLTNVNDNETAESSMFQGQTEIFQDIIIAGTQPFSVSSLTAESEEKALVLLEWKDSNYDPAGVLIYRFDHDDDDKKYKRHLIETIREANVESYEDRSVKKGDRYTYYVVPFTGASRSVYGDGVTIKAKDTSDTKICFISSATDDFNTAITGLLILGFTIFAFTAFKRRKI